MSSWDVAVRPHACRGLAVLAIAAHLAAAGVPWLAGCHPALAAALSLAAAVGALATLRSIPGPWARLRCMRARGGAWTAVWSDGTEGPFDIRPGTRVYRDVVVLRGAGTAGNGSWIIPRSSLDRDAFRRLKVRLRAGQHRTGRVGPDGRMQ